MKKKILLVCTGNTCRSPMAETLARDMLKQIGLRHYGVSSAGIAAFTGDPASSSAVEVMREMGIDLSRHRAKMLTPGLAVEADLIITMTRQQREMVLKAVPEAGERVFVLKEMAELGYLSANPGAKWDITDPIGKPLAVYRQVAAELKNSLYKIFSLMKEQEDSYENRCGQ